MCVQNDKFQKVGIEILYWLTGESVGGATFSFTLSEEGEKAWIHLLTM